VASETKLLQPSSQPSDDEALALRIRIRIAKAKMKLLNLDF
jgi:hypothetical protein